MELPIVCILLLSVLMISHCYVMPPAEKARPCNIAYRCSSEVDPVWTTDGKSCQVFRNGCLLLGANCDRQNNYQPELEETTKEKCQRLCNSECPKEDSPVCGSYNEEKRTFSSHCAMDNHICKTGETFSLYRLEPCQ